MSGFWTIVFAVGAVQGAFLCGALFLRRSSNNLATRLLAALVAVATAMIVLGALVDELALSYGHLLVFVNINTELALAPLTLLFARSLIEPARRLTRGDAVHFLPLVLGLALWIVAWVALGDEANRLTFLATGSAVPLYMVFKCSLLLAYMAATYQTLRSETNLAQIRAQGRRTVHLAWLRQSILVLVAMVVAIYAVNFAERFGWPLPFEADPFASLLLAVMIYMASLMVLQQPWVLSLRPRPMVQDRWQDEADRLKSYLQQERPWLRPDLALSDLSEALGTTDHRLSTLLREGLDTSFYGLVSSYRLAEFERLAKDPATRHRSVLELAFEAGFNSKASFYRAFRQSHEITPTAFRSAI